MQAELIQPDPRTAEPCPWWAGNAAVLTLWLLAGGVMLVLAWGLPLERTQEARVLEGAREMLGGGWREWMVPHANGVVRLQKPPLAYWMAAGSFKVFGVSVLAGRLPMALAGWLTLAATWLFGRSLLDRRAAFFAAALLAGNFYFARYAALAETDVLTMLFGTIATGAIWRASEEAGRVGVRVGWYQLAAVAMAGALMSKGPPAVYALLFLIGLASLRRWRILWQWVSSGSWVTILILALPWWLYIRSLPQSGVIVSEVSDILTGRDHHGHFWDPFLFVLQAGLPWVAFVVLGLWLGASRCRRERPVAVLLIYVASVFVPLMLIPQKQEHYVLPLLPPLMLLGGSVLDRAVSWKTPSLSYMTGGFLAVTVIAGLASAVAIPIVGYVVRHHMIAADWILAGLLGMLMAGTLLLNRQSNLRVSLPTGMLAGIIAVPLVLAWWAPSLKPMTYQQVATALRQRYGAGPYAFVQADDLRLCFLMQRRIELVPVARQLAEIIPSRPGLVILHEEDKDIPPLKLPGLAHQEQFLSGRKAMVVYRIAPSAVER